MNYSKTIRHLSILFLFFFSLAQAEESASAAEELSAQAEGMGGMVQELVRLVGGAESESGNQSAATGTRGAPTKLDQADKAWHNIAASANAKSQSGSQKSAEEVIPLGDEQLKNF